MPEQNSILDSHSVIQKPQIEKFSEIEKQQHTIYASSPLPKPIEEAIKHVELLLNVGDLKLEIKKTEIDERNPDEIKKTLSEMKELSISSKEKISEINYEDTVLKELSEINPSAPGEIERMNTLVMQTTTTISEVRDAVAAIKQYKSSAREMLEGFKKGKYATKKMTEEEAINVINNFSNNIHELSRDKMFLGRFLHKGEIGEKSREIKELTELMKEVKETERVHDPNDLDDLTLNDIEKLAGTISVRVASTSIIKMYEHYNEKLNTEIIPEQKIVLSKNAIRRICEGDIKSSFLEKLSDLNSQDAKEAISQEDISEAVEIIRLAQKAPDKRHPQARLPDSSLLPVFNEIDDRIRLLPLSIKNILYYEIAEFYGAEDYLKDVQKYVNAYDTINIKAQIIEESKEFVKQATEITKGRYSYTKEWNNLLNTKSKNEEITEDAKKNMDRYSYIFGNYYMRFPLVKNFFTDPEVLNALSSDQIATYQADVVSKFNNTMVENELQSRTNFYTPDNLFTYSNPNTLPFQALFAFNRFTGYYPADYYGGLHTYLKDLNTDEYAVLSKGASESVLNFFDLVRNGPDEKALSRTLYTYKSNGEVDEAPNLPALGIEKAAIQIISEVLDTGTLAEQKYAVQSLVSLHSQHEELNVVLSKCFKSTHPEIKDYATHIASSISPRFPSSINLIVENYDVLKSSIQVGTSQEISKTVAEHFISGSPLALDNLDTVSEILNIPQEALMKCQEFTGKYKEKIGYFPHLNSIGDFQQIIHISESPELSKFTFDLLNRGVNSEGVLRNIDVLMQYDEKVTTELDDIQLFIPNYEYYPVIGISGKMLMPYELFLNWDMPGFVKSFDKAHKKNPALTKDATNRLMNALLETHPVLRDLPSIEPSEESRNLFFDGLLQVSRFANFSEDSPEHAMGKILDSRYALHFFARQPEKVQEVINLPNTNPEFFTLLQPGGPLYSNREIILRDILSNGSIERRVKEISSVFTKKVPYWKQLYMFTNTRIGEALANAETSYPIAEVSGATWANLVKRHNEMKENDPERITRLESIVASPHIRSELIKSQIDTVPFNEINGVYKKLIFRDYLRKSLETSRSEIAKEFASERNREFTTGIFEFKPEMYIHGGMLNVIDYVLSRGNLPKEALGENAGTDSFPFQVDFSRITTELLEQYGESITDIVDHTLSKKYGDGIYYVYDRAHTDWEPGRAVYGYGEKHALMLGGVPSTEVSGILLRYPEKQFEATKNAVLDNGMFIPIYGFDGKLLFSPEEYDQQRQEYNLNIPVDIWDYTLQTDGQKGSNPGAEFTIPSKDGPEKYYVKYVDREQLDHLWSEQLADNLYKVLEIPVPETKIVRVNNAFGHASKLLPIEETFERPGLKDGFIADSLLGNWDAVFNQNNNLVSNGKTYRIDNGGALQFRARGQRKEDVFFGEVVREVEVGTDRQRLGLGMRQEYPELTDEDIKIQVASLQEKLTDTEIDQQVNLVRLPASEREHLARVLKERKNYIIERFSYLL